MLVEYLAQAHGNRLEVAARNHLLKQSGQHAAARFVREITEELGVEPPPESDAEVAE